MVKKTLIVGIVLFLAILASAVSYRFLNRTVGRSSSDYSSLTVSRAGGNEIFRTDPGVRIRFEAIVVNHAQDNCIDLFTPEVFDKYGGDLKWAISATLGFEPGIFERVRPMGKGIVTGKYSFVRDVQNGPCGIVTGNVFEIEHLEYF